MYEVILFMNEMKLEVPMREGVFISPGTRILLNRFQNVVWVVDFGWYSVNGNRPICGWYLYMEDNHNIIKSIQMPDIYDIYLIKDNTSIDDPEIIEDNTESDTPDAMESIKEGE